LWWAWQRAEQERAVTGDLGEVEGHLQAGRLAEARAALERAEGRVAGGGPADLLRRVHRMRDDMALVDRLDRIRLKAVMIVEGRFDQASADRGYAALFRERGLAVAGEDPGAVSARIRGSAVRTQLVAALDDWAVATESPSRRAWLLEVARRAEPGAWSDRFRDPAAWRKRAALEQLAREANVAELSPQLLAALGQVLRRTRADAMPLLAAAQRRHSADFWLNVLMANVLVEKARPEEAVGYYRAALAVRPGTSAVHCNLGLAQHARGLLEDAIQECQRAIDLDPTLGEAHNNLGCVLSAQGRLDDAIREYRQAIELGPRNALAHSNLGAALYEKGLLDEAIRECRRAIALDPENAKAHDNLGNALRAKGQVDKAIEEHRKATALDPEDAKAHNNLGTALHDKGQVDDAIREFSKAIKLDPRYARAHTNLGTALWDRGRLGDAIEAYRKAIELDPKWAPARHGLGIALYDTRRLDDAIEAIQEAIKLDPRLPGAHYSLGLALRARGRLDEAITAYRKAIALQPDDAQAHCNLGHALRDQGHFRAALQALHRGHQLGMRNPRWRYPSADWVRQCQRLLELDARLPALLRGDDRPASAAERLDLARLCGQYQQRYAAAARFYAEAFADQPRLADDLDSNCRYNAACAAALAAAGRGRDAAALGGQERARLRRQARDWLRADLAAWTKGVEKARPVVQRTLTHWQQDPDLAGLRDRDALAQLPEAERQACRNLWAEVDALRKRTGPEPKPALPPQTPGQRDG
jgi:tetratricopeptide (TPR) repeat protein